MPAEEEMSRIVYRAGNAPGIIMLILFSLVCLFLVGPFSMPLALLLIFVYFLLSVKILREYERGVVLTLGRYTGVVGPGPVVIIPIFQSLRIVDLRITTIDIPPQEVITKDNVSVKVDGVVYFRVIDPAKAVLKVKDYVYAISRYAQTTLRDVVGSVELDELLEERDRVAADIRTIVDEKAAEWGVDITDIKLQNVSLPESMKRAMAVQAEAERERRAVITKAEGEKIAAKNYAEAASILATTRGAMSLRILQTINDISKDPSQKIIILLPVEFFEFLKNAAKK